MISRSVKINVCGRVQGVGFRYSTQRQAEQNNLRGYVKNLDNGNVEIVASGEDTAISALLVWLDEGGPTYAKITEFTVMPYDELTAYSHFRIT